jgi:glycosyltransferase involved in cell wall biosynthesis
MAMGKAIVSTALGAEGIEAVPGQDLLLADEPGPFADAVVRLLADPALAARMGQAGRGLAERKYSWHAAALRLEAFFEEILAARRAGAREGAC